MSIQGPELEGLRAAGEVVRAMLDAMKAEVRAKELILIAFSAPAAGSEFRSA